MTDWTETKRLMLLEDDSQCQVLLVAKGRYEYKCPNQATDLHHCLISKNKRFGKWLDKQTWNYQPTCPKCNRTDRDADKGLNRKHWFDHQVDVLGLDVIKNGIESAEQELDNFNKLRDFNTDYQEVVKWIKEIEG